MALLRSQFARRRESRHLWNDFTLNGDMSWFGISESGRGWEERFENGYGLRQRILGSIVYDRVKDLSRTELNHDLKDPRRYLTLDFWDIHGKPMTNFRAKHAAEYGAIGSGI